MSNVHPFPSEDDDHAIERRPQADENAEQMILGSCMDDSRAYTEAVDAGLVRSDFYKPAHQLLWDVIGVQVAAGQPTHPVALHAEIGKLGRLREVAGGQLIDTIGLLNVPAGSVSYFAELVMEKARLRRAEDLALRIKAEIGRGSGPDIIDQLIADHQQNEKRRTTADSATDRFVDGASFILDIPDTTPAVWGEGDQVLWAEGEALIIAGPAGVGKTTVAQQVVLAAIGVRPHALGYAVRPAKKVLYLASDRPPQAARSMRRMVGPEHRDILAQHLVIWKGPPPQDFAKNPDILLRLCEQAGADMVCLDSLKDMASELSKDEVGGAINSAVQRTLVAGVEVLALHHYRKRSGGDSGKEPTTLDELYGSTWITAGAGSVVSLWGTAGDLIVSMRHLKQPAAECGPWRLKHDHVHGVTEVWHEVDLMQILLHAKGALTPSQLAVQIYPPEKGKKPSASEVEKARRRLESLVSAGLASKVPGAGGRGRETGYVATYSETGEIG